MMKVCEFEDKVWEIEGIRIVIRAPSEKEVLDYDYQNAAQGNWRIAQLLEGRIQPNLEDMEIIVLQGDGEQPHGRAILRTIRQSYL